MKNFKNQRNIYLKNLLGNISLVLISLLFIFPTQASSDDNFDPGLLITDQIFGNYEAFNGPDSIQRFLETRGSILADTSTEFLRKLKEPADLDLKTRLDDPRPNLGRLRTAAELIYDAATLSKINPQIILVTLQKEQSLIDGKFTDSSVLQRRLDRAMGFACPDSGGCGDLFLGFYHQLFGNVDKDGERYLGSARSLAKSYYTEINGVKIGRGPAIDDSGNTFGSNTKVKISKVGDTIILDNTVGPPYYAPVTSIVVLKNAATAALYRYTPHVYNGNYNFWKFFRQWFKFGNGSLVKLTGRDNVYFIDNGQRREVSGTVMTMRKLDVTTSFTLSESEFTEYAEAKPLPPPEKTLISPSTGSVRYIVEDSKLRPLSDFVAKLSKLDLNKTIYLPDNEVNAYEVGERALPPEGTLLKPESSQEISIVQGKSLRPISSFVFKQRKFSFADVVVAPDAEATLLKKTSPLPPVDGTLVKSKGSPLVYYVALGQKYPIPGFVFNLRKFKFSNVVTLGDDEIKNLALADHLAPADGTLLKAKNIPTVYLVEAGSLHYVTGFLFGYNKYKSRDVVQISEIELSLIPENSPLHLPDDTLIKLKNDGTVYILDEGSKHPMTYEAFITRKLKFFQVVEIPVEEGERYPTGEAITK